jgi:hypothetical protein
MKMKFQRMMIGMAIYMFISLNNQRLQETFLKNQALFCLKSLKYIRYLNNYLYFCPSNDNSNHSLYYIFLQKIQTTDFQKINSNNKNIFNIVENGCFKRESIKKVNFKTSNLLLNSIKFSIGAIVFFGNNAV